MKLKKFALLALIVGAILLGLGVAGPFLVLHSAGKSIGIIGGADVHTYRYIWSHVVLSWPGGALLLGAALSLSAVFCLLFTKTVQKHCRVNTSLVAVGLSSVGAAGLVCFLLWMATAAFGERDRYPIVYAYSIFLGAACFFAFLGLCALYVVLRKKNSSLLGILIDVFTSILYLPGFFTLLFWLAKILDG